MFKKDKSKSKPARIDTLIGQYTHIKGDISFSGGLRIDGSVSGNINAAGDDNALLTLSEKGTIEGEVRVPNLVINGIVNGNIYAASHVELATKARINGNVYYRMLEMAMGSEVNGHLIRAKPDEENILSVDHEIFDDDDDQPALHLERKD